MPEGAAELVFQDLALQVTAIRDRDAQPVRFIAQAQDITAGKHL